MCKFNSVTHKMNMVNTYLLQYLSADSVDVVISDRGLTIVQADVGNTQLKVLLQSNVNHRFCAAGTVLYF